MKSPFSRLPVFPSSRLLIFLVAAILLITTTAFAQVALNPDLFGVVEIPDPNLEGAIRDQLNLEFLAVPPDEPITQFNMLRLGWLDGRGKNITDLTGLEYATNLTHLYLGGNNIENLEPLAELINLELLGLFPNRIQDVTPLANLINLKYLWIQGNPITDITPLQGLNLIEFFYDEPPAEPESDQVVEIPDRNLEGAIRDQLNLEHPIPPDEPITQQDMLLLIWFDGREKNITDLTGLEYATNLTHSDLAVNAIENLEPLAGLIRLQTLDLSDNQIVDITPLANLTNLTELEVSSNQVRDLNPLAGLTRLTFLGLWNNRISDLNPLMNLTALQTLWLNSNEIVDITPLANLTNLTELTLSQNQVRDLTPLMNLTALETLWLNSNVIVDITPLANLTNLTELRASQNQVRDLNPLVNLTALQTLRLNMNAIVDITPLSGLKNLKELRIADNPIGDFTPLTELEGVELDLEVDFNQLDQLHLVVTIPDPNLEGAIRDQLNWERPTFPPNAPITQQDILKLTWLDSRGKNITDLTGLEDATNLIVLYLGGNQIQDITPLANLTKLENLDLSFNAISEVESLASLIQLQTLNFTANPIQDITPLTHLINLERLHISGNLVTDFTPLQELNLIYLEYDEVCDFPPFQPPVRERMERRSFPSIFQMWDAVLGVDHLTEDQHIALHDLTTATRFPVTWDSTPTEPTPGLATSLAGRSAWGRERHQRHISQNPNKIYLGTVGFHSHSEEDYPPGSDFLLRDGKRRNYCQNARWHSLRQFFTPRSPRPACKAHHCSRALWFLRWCCD